MLEIRNIKVKYGDVPVIKGIGFTVKKGERLVVVGESGCGKTTLLKTIAGYVQADSGDILVDNERVKGPNEQLVPGHPKIKLVNQDFGLDTYHTVEENINLRLLQFDADYRAYRLEKLLKVTALEKFRHMKAHVLSGGQKQRLAIARALADEPEVLLLDEPFNQLDYFLRQKIENFIDDYLKSEDITLIMVSHNGEETMRWGQKVLFLNNGKIAREDSPINFYNQPKNKKEAGFFGVVNTVLHEGKYVSFRPHAFALKKSTDYSLKLPVKLLKTVNKGWYIDHLYQFNTKTIHLYHAEPLPATKTVYIKPLF